MAPRKIMIVEDDAIVSWAIKIQLEAWGYRVSGVFGGGKEAIEAFKCDMPDLVLLDIFLSDDVDGVCVAQEIRKTSDTPFIYITASRDRRTFERAMQTNPAEIISKPYSEAMLKRSIERVMSEI